MLPLEKRLGMREPVNSSNERRAIKGGMKIIKMR